MNNYEEKLNNNGEAPLNNPVERNDSGFEALLEGEGRRINNAKYAIEPASEDFKQRLKSQILERRSQNKSMKTKALDFIVNAFKPKRFAPLVAVMMIILIITNLIPASLFLGKPESPFSNFSKLLINPAYAENNFELTASDNDSLGIEASSIFVLTSKEALDTNLIKDNLTIEPKIDYDLKKVSDTEWQIIPAQPIDPNTIVKISLDTAYQLTAEVQKERDYSWAFQVKDTFKVINSIPRDKGTSVPTNSGIEITFSYDNFKDYEKYFEIQPATTGRFEKHGRTLVFVPKSLLSNTVYTVTIKKGLPLDGSDEVLATDYKMAFETETQTNKSYYGNYFYVYDRFLEIGSNQNPLVQIYSSLNSGQIVDVEIYKYSSADSFLTSLKQRDSIPWWAYSKDDYREDTSKLQKIGNFKTEIKQDNRVKYLEFPSTLDKGFYLFALNHDKDKEQVWAQVGDLSAYLNVTKTDTLVWVNNVVSEQPANGANVQLVGFDNQQRTNNKGVSVFATPSELLNANDSSVNESERYYFKITQADNVLFVPASALSRSYWYYSNYSKTDDYWQYLYTDRPRYQTTDTIKYWGMLKNRNGEKIKDEDVTISLYKQGYLDYFYRPVKVAENKVQFTDFDTFTGEIKLDNVRPDYYTLEVKVGDTVIKTKYIEVKAYTKPTYNLELTADKTVAFAGDEIHLLAKASFFEGTPVPGLKLNYTTPQGSEEVTTDDQGEVHLVYTKKYVECNRDYYCWPDYESIYISPEMSELSDMEADVTLRFYGPKIYLNNKVEYPEKGVGLLTIQSKLIDLNTEANANWWERNLGKDPAPNTKVEGEVKKITYVKHETGTRYDFISKKTYTTYNYDRNEEIVDNFSGTTDNNGNYAYRINLEPKTSYEVKIKAYDADGRVANDQEYLYYYDGNKITRYTPYDYNYYHLVVDTSKKYSVGDEVEAKFMNNDDPMPDGQNRYLYLQLQNGLQEYSLGDSHVYKFNFENRDIPNVNLASVYFTGHSYITSNSGYWDQSVVYNNSNKALKINISTDQAKYQPGDKVKLSLQVTDMKNNPIASELNLNLVDEAYYALFEDTADPLSEIYANVSSGSIFSRTTNENVNDEMSGAEKGGCFAAGTKILMADGSEKNIEDIKVGDEVKTFDNSIDLNLTTGEVSQVFKHIIGEYMVVNDNLKVTPEHIVYASNHFEEAGQLKIGDWMLNSKGEKVLVRKIEIKHDVIPVYNFTVSPEHTYFANDYYVHNEKGGGPREFFTDAALFKSVVTDTNGRAIVELTLPDNITSWRVTAQAISKNLYVGANTGKIPVSLPVFEEVTIGNEYLAQDKPIARLRAYGVNLDKNDTVSFNVKAPSLGIGQSAPLDAKAFQAAYYQLPDLKIGDHKLTYELKTAKGNDAVKLPMSVISSRLEASFANSEKLSTNTQIKAVNNEPVTVVLSDQGQNMLYQPLMNLSWQWGDRVDQILARVESTKLLSKYYDYGMLVPNFEPFNYQLSSGGVALLPYSSDDLELSVRVAAIGAPEFDQEALSQYFFKVLENKDSNREEISLALSGLASLNKPVLPRISNWLERNDLSVKEKIYLAQALFNLGDEEKSRQMYYEILSQHGESKEPQIIIRVSDNQDEVFQATAMMATLAASLNMDEAWGMWNYLLDNQTLHGLNKNSENLFNLEKLNYIEKSLVNLKPSPAKIKYQLFGQEKEIELTGGQTYSIYLDPSQVNELKFLQIQGEVGVSTVYVKPIDLADLSKDSDVEIRREYYVNGKKTDSFKENDTIEVRLYPSFGAKALPGSYQITDILPSGLLPVTKYYTGGKYYDCHYWYPYNSDGQKVKYIIYKDWQGSYCGGNYISYYAQVKNLGEYKAEPALIQSFINPDYVNYSAGTMVKITK